MIAVDHAAVRGGEASVATRTLSIDSVNVAGMRVLAWMNPDSHLNYEAWASGPVDTSQEWHSKVRLLQASGLGFVLEDRRTRPAARFQVSGGSVRVDSFSTAAEARFPLSFACSLGTAGYAEGRGVIKPAAPSADLQLDVRGFDLRQIQPYVSTSSKVDIVRGTVDAKGHFAFNTHGTRGPLMRFEGRASSRRFAWELSQQYFCRLFSHKVGVIRRC